MERRPAWIFWARAVSSPLPVRIIGKATHDFNGTAIPLHLRRMLGQSTLEEEADILADHAPPRQQNLGPLPFGKWRLCFQRLCVPEIGHSPGILLHLWGLNVYRQLYRLRCFALQ